MKHTRLEQLYNQGLSRAELTHKQLPLSRILAQDIDCHPSLPTNWSFDFLEIGSGTGDFLFFLAGNHPQKRILGIELGTKRYESIKERLVFRNMTNVTLIHGDARTVVYKHLPDQSIGTCYLLFPDPWPRNRHRHLRLMQREFCQVLAEKLRPGGDFILATDVQDYALWVNDNLGAIPSLVSANVSAQLDEPPDTLIPTFFQKKWQALGRRFWYVRFCKK